MVKFNKYIENGKKALLGLTSYFLFVNSPCSKDMAGVCSLPTNFLPIGVPLSHLRKLRDM